MFCLTSLISIYLLYPSIYLSILPGLTPVALAPVLEDTEQEEDPAQQEDHLEATVKTSGQNQIIINFIFYIFSIIIFYFI